MNEEKWQVVYHYTSLNGFQRILETGCLALSDIIKSNDPAEGIYSMQMMQEAYHQLFRDNEIDNDVYHLFHKAFFEFSEEEKSFGRLRQAILSVSFCEPEFPLALWRTYGDNGRGVSLGVSKKKLEEIGKRNNFIFRPVEYLSETEMIEKYLSFWKSHISSDTEALKKALKEQYFEGYFIKRSENSYEKEWRLVYTGLKFDEYFLVSPTVPENICAYMRQDDVVFYYKLPLKDETKGESLLDSVYIGPQCKVSDNEMRCLLSKFAINVCGVRSDDTIMR